MNAAQSISGTDAPVAADLENPHTAGTPHRGALRRRLFTLFLLTSAIPALGVWVLMTNTATQTARDLLGRELQAESRRGSAELRTMMRIAEATLMSLARSDAVKAYTVPAADPTAAEMLPTMLRQLAAEYHDMIAAVGVVTEDGRLLGARSTWDGKTESIDGDDVEARILSLADESGNGDALIKAGTLVDRRGRLAPLIAPVPNGGTCWLLFRIGSLVERVAPMLVNRPGGWAIVSDADGIVVLASDDRMRGASLAHAAPPLSDSIEPRPSGTPSVLLRMNGRLDAVARTALDYPGWFLFVGAPVAEATTPIRRASLRSLALVLFAVIAAFVAVFVTTRRIGRHLERLSKAAERVARGHLTEPVALRSGDELEDLASAFNEMMDRLHRNRRALIASTQELAQKERLAHLGRFIAVIAHELKNPLGIIKVAASALASVPPESAKAVRLREIVTRETGRLEETLRRLLDHARPRTLALSRFDAAAWLASVADSVRADFEAHGVHLDAGPATAAIPLRADADQLRGALLNVLLNARQASPESGTVILRVEEEPGSWIRITVRDRGPGLPDHVRQHLYQPFITGRENGIGLGLANAHTVVKTHGGTISVEDGPTGGTDVVIRLPARGAARHDDA